MICIDGTQDDLLNGKPRGIVAMFELWATEEEIMAYLNHLRALTPVESPNLVMSAALGQKAINLIVRMRRDSEFVFGVKEQIREKLRAFRADPVVGMQTRYYRELRAEQERKMRSLALLVLFSLLAE